MTSTVAHPRVSGENIYEPGVKVDNCGSSPRERGKLSRDFIGGS